MMRVVRAALPFGVFHLPDYGNLFSVLVDLAADNGDGA